MQKKSLCIIMTRKYHTANCIWLYFALTSLYVYIKLSSDANQILLNNIILLIISITNWNKKWMTKSSYKYNFYWSYLMIFQMFAVLSAHHRSTFIPFKLFCGDFHVFYKWNTWKSPQFNISCQNLSNLNVERDVFRNAGNLELTYLIEKYWMH